MSADILYMDEWRARLREKNTESTTEVLETGKCDRGEARELYDADLDTPASVAAQELVDYAYRYLVTSGLDKSNFKDNEDYRENLKLWYWFSLSVKAIVFHNFDKKDHPFVQDVLRRVDVDAAGRPRLREDAL